MSAFADEKPLIVEIIVPHYLFSLLTTTWADEPQSWIGGVVTLKEYGEYVCEFHGFESDNGDWLICCHGDDGKMLVRTFIELVEKIVVL